MTTTDNASARNGSSVHQHHAPPKPTQDNHRRRWLGLFVIAFAQLMIVVDGTIITVALPAMSNALSIAPDDRQWVITVYTLSFGGLLLIGGRIADYLGLRRAFVIGLVGFGLASALGGAAQTFSMMLFARALQGVFGALLAPVALALVANLFSEARERAKAFAIFGAVAGGGSAIGLVLGGLLTEYVNWRWTMYINTPIAFLTVAGAYALLDEHRGEHPGRLDVIGTVLSSVGVLSLVYGFSEAERHGWAKPATLAFLGIGVALSLAFVVSQRIVANPVLPLRVLADRTRGGANLAVLLSAVAMFGSFFFLTFFMQGVLGYSPVKTGLGFLAVTAGIMVSSGIVSAVGHKVPPRYFFAGGLLGAGIGSFLLTGLTMHSTYTRNLMPALMLLGVSLGCVFVPAFNAATIGVAPRDASVASAVINTSQQVGTSLGVALLSTIAANRTKNFLSTHEFNPLNVLQAQVVGLNAAALGGGILLVGAALVTGWMVNIKKLDLSMVGEGAGMMALESPGSSTAIGVEQIEHLAAHPRTQPLGANHAVPVPMVGGDSAKLTDVPTPPRRSVDGVVPDTAAPGWAASGAPGARPIIGRPVGPRPTAASAEAPGPAEVGSVPGPAAGALSGDALAVVRDASGAPVAGAVWTVLDTAGRQLGHGRSGADGSFAFVAVDETDVVLVVRHPGHRPYACAVHLAGDGPGSAGLQVDVTLVSGLAVTGVVRGGDGGVIPGARVWLEDPTGDVIARTAADSGGRYEFADVPSGSYRLLAAGYSATGQDLTVADGRDVEAQLTVAPADLSA
ncbi:MAG TPA: DHA2 family efflux MFS transporter permease subunit [Sporichthyaceae bacterium]|jgi:EmrB/QacA subfamily drug resistance transporter|nr:DHA2 family efflux MFS transporter permease subunit [Sporichthyaceae bacterium]